MGLFFLGLPAGFNRLGIAEDTRIHIYEKFEDGWGYDKYNVPVWKYLDENNNTIVRGICPRNNYPWIHIFLENCVEKIECIEITNDEMNEMDY